MELKEENIKALVTVILLGLSMLTVLLLESRATGSVGAHFVFICAGMLLLMLIVFGIWLEEEWAYTLSILFFTGGLAHMTWLYSSTKSLLPFSFGILVTLSGLVLCMINTQPTSHRIETYDVTPIERLQKEIEREIKSTKTSKKRSTTKKKRKKRKTKRKTKRKRK